MGNHNQRGNGNGQLPLVESIPIETLCESRRDQYWPTTAFEFNPLYMRLLLPCARELYRLLSYKAWNEKNLVVRGAQSYLASNTCLGTGAIKRHLCTLRRYRFIRLHRYSKAHGGNEHYIEPLLIGEYDWKLLRNLPQSEFYAFTRGGREQAVRWIRHLLDHFDPTGLDRVWPLLFPQLDQNDPRHGSFRSNPEEMARTLLDQNDPQIYSLYSFLADDAQRHAPPNKLEGGEERPQPSDAQGERRSPTGQDHTPGKEGVGKSADETWAQYGARMAARVGTRTGVEENPAVG